MSDFTVMTDDQLAAAQEAQAAIAKQAARIAALEQDAARLAWVARYLVNYDGSPDEHDALMDAKTPHEFILAIDAAIEKGGA